MGRSVSTSIHISAPLALVSRILNDWSSFPEWSVFISTISGESKSPGSKISVVLKPSETKDFAFTPTLLVCSPNQLKWRGSALFGAFVGEHNINLSEAEVDGVKGTEVLHEEVFNGVLVPLAGWIGTLGKTKKNFIKFNKALKSRAEGMVGSEYEGAT